MNENANKQRGRPKSVLTKTVYLVNGQLRKRGRPSKALNNPIYKVQIPIGEIYDPNKHGIGVIVSE